MRRRPSAEAEGDSTPAPSNADIASALVEGAGGSSKPDESNANKESRNLHTTAATRRPDTKINQTPHELDRRKSTDKRHATARSRRPSSSTNWQPAQLRDGDVDKDRPTETSVLIVSSKEDMVSEKMPESRQNTRRSRLRSPWSISFLTLITTALALLSLASIIHSFSSRQLDTKGCRMSYMRPSFAKLSDFDTEHTRFASKYSVYLYREGMVDEDTKVHNSIKR